jgi:hypothetical protein
VTDTADERAHAPGPDSWWWETWHLDAAGADGVGVSVRLAYAPGLGVAWWWTHVLLPDLPGPVVVRDHEVGLPRQGLEIHADGLWGELTCESPFEHWTYGLEAFGVRLDDPADSLRGEIGERIPVGLDIEWEAVPAVVPHDHDPARENGYEQFGVVHGEVLVGRSRFELDAVGLRSHSWGAPRFGRSECSAWLHSPELAVSFAVSDGLVDGYIVREGRTEPISTVRTETRRRADGLPVAARHVVDLAFEVESEVLGLVAIPLAGPAAERAVLARGLCTYEVDEPGPARIDRPLIGWSSWSDPARN